MIKQILIVSLAVSQKQKTIRRVNSLSREARLNLLVDVWNVLQWPKTRGTRTRSMLLSFSIMKSIFALFASSSLLALLVQVSPASAQFNESRFGSRFDRTNVIFTTPRRPVFDDQGLIRQPLAPRSQLQGFGQSSGSYFGW